LDPVALIEFLRPRMAHFMIPRFVRMMPELPKTPTQKVQKNLLREEGITADTWDRERAGVVIRRDKLAQSGIRLDA
jgi:crotonobetaine/carnitine-CoA ligase